MSRESLISLCERTEEEPGLIGGLKEGDRVIKLSDEIAVKYGYGVTPAEAATQRVCASKYRPQHCPCSASPPLLSRRA